MFTDNKKIGHLKILITTIKRGYWKLIFHEIKRRLYSVDNTYVIRRNLLMPFKNPNTKIKLTIREIRKDDILKLFDIDSLNISANEYWNRIRRLSLLKTDIKKCYVAVTQKGVPCHIHWLIEPNENEKLQIFSRGGFLILKENEMLLEGGYTPEAHRNCGIQSFAMSQLCEVGKKNGARWVLGFIRQLNIPSLKTAQKAGFKPYMIRKEKWIMFRRKFEYIFCPSDAQYPFETDNEREPF
ncbi:MAG TPA: hypothetical protein HA348_06865 [Thermoplasmata archaeon]|nr:hypothetical protein [Thermoplasmata archaeon]